MAARIASTRALLGLKATERPDLPADFTRLPFTAGGTALQVTSSITGVATVLRRRRPPRRSGTEHRHGHRGRFRHRQRAAAATVEGSVTVLDAPADVRELVDLWGPVPGLDLMRRLKDQLDPDHRLSPGRFVCGI